MDRVADGSVSYCCRRHADMCGARVALHATNMAGGWCASVAVGSVSYCCRRCADMCGARVTLHATSMAGGWCASVADGSVSYCCRRCADMCRYGVRVAQHARQTSCWVVRPRPRRSGSCCNRRRAVALGWGCGPHCTPGKKLLGGAPCCPCGRGRSGQQTLPPPHRLGVRVSHLRGQSAKAAAQVLLFLVWAFGERSGFCSGLLQDPR